MKRFTVTRKLIYLIHLDTKWRTKEGRMIDTACMIHPQCLCSSGPFKATTSCWLRCSKDQIPETWRHDSIAQTLRFCDSVIILAPYHENHQVSQGYWRLSCEGWSKFLFRGVGHPRGKCLTFARISWASPCLIPPQPKKNKTTLPTTIMEVENGSLKYGFPFI